MYRFKWPKKTHRQLFLSSPLSPRELSRPCPCFVAASSSSSLAGFGTTPTVSTSLSPSSTTTRTTMPSTSSTTTRTTMPSTPSSGEGHLHHSYWQACVFSQSLPDLEMKWKIILVKKHRKNCECCPGPSLIANHYSSMSILNRCLCSHCGQCLLVSTSVQGGRTWQAFVDGKNSHENFCQARINNFCDKCVVFARNRKFAKLAQWNMQYIPCNSALLAQETLYLTPKGTFFAQRSPKSA